MILLMVCNQTLKKYFHCQYFQCCSLALGYLKNRYVGRTIGRVNNRVSDGFMYIDNKKYQLTRNDNKINHINGGFCGFDNANWDSYVLGKEVVLD